jgi:hypothetical protein
VAPAREALGLHFKNVGEITANQYLKDKVQALAAVVVDVQDLVK